MYSETEKAGLRFAALLARRRYRAYLRGDKSSWGRSLRELSWWKSTPERWAWLNAKCGLDTDCVEALKEGKRRRRHRLKTVGSALEQMRK